MAITNYAPGQELSSIDFQSMIGGPLNAIVDAQAQAALSTVDFIKAVGFTPDSEDVTTGEITPGTPIYVSFKYPKMVEPYKPAINGIIETISVGDGGSEYSVGDAITVSGTGSGATATISAVGSDGEATTITVTNGGSGYENGSVPVSGGSGTGLTVTIATTNTDAVPAVFNEMQLEVPILTMLPIPFIRVEEGEIDFHAKITSMEYANVGSKFKSSTSFGYNSTTSGGGSASTGFITSLFAKSSANLKYSRSVNFKVNASYQRTSRQGNKVEKTFQLGVKVKITQDEIPAGMEKLLGILEDAIVAQPTGG
ncbi:hypothetical protein MNBD_GAMMA04-2098 [hydrothermal vent metagenome]|uniref:Uncharacterized protein n=1 Tax=hydrothermal vent metagenome TaxID=652676 RepID=A0A3B0VVV2_9ZZZZ